LTQYLILVILIFIFIFSSKKDQIINLFSLGKEFVQGREKLC